MIGADLRQRLLQLHAEAADPRPPLRPRHALWTGDARIGSLEPALLDGLAWPSGVALLEPVTELDGAPAWRLQGEPTASLALLAQALRVAGRAIAWRDELLAVEDEAGRRVAVVERGVTRPLGIATRAVHMVGERADGRVWVQQRSLTKANDPGKWDTLMGGMVPASDSLEETLARETWEEAGLRIGQLRQLRRVASPVFRLPSTEEWGGYIVERIDWYRCVLPDDVKPANQDGEVAQFACITRDALVQGLLQRDYTWAAEAIHTQLLLADAS